METLRKYYTDLLSGTPSFSWAKKEAMAFRRQNASVCLQGLSLGETRSVLLAPLLYRFPEEMETPDTVRATARSLVLAVLTSSHDVDQKIREFLQVFDDFRENEARELRQSLFTNRYELSRVVDAEPSVAPTLEKVESYIKTLGWESEYNAFEQTKNEQAIDRLTSTMDRAFWDLFRESLVKNDFGMLTSTLEEIHALVREIHHPSLSDRGTPYVDDLFSFSQSWSEIPVGAIQSWFVSVLKYLEECDAPAMESVYKNAVNDVLASTEDRADVVVHGLESVYALVLPLRAKIHAFLDADKN
jgi:hypothetical protein